MFKNNNGDENSIILVICRLFWKPSAVNSTVSIVNTY